MILPRLIPMTPSRRALKSASEDPGGGSIAAGVIVTESAGGTALYGFLLCISPGLRQSPVCEVAISVAFSGYFDCR
jgi:hypothetical protein